MFFGIKLSHLRTFSYKVGNLYNQKKEKKTNTKSKPKKITSKIKLTFDIFPS